MRFILKIPVLILAAAALFSCDLQIDDVVKPGAKGAKTPIPTPEASPPKLTNLWFDGGSPRLAGPDGEDAAFNPDVYSYTAELPLEDAETTINAEAPEDCEISFPTGKTFTPLAGSISLVTVSTKNGLKNNYTISYFKGPLPPAVLSSITLSIGEIEDFSPDKTEYEIVVPYGTESAVVFAESPLEGAAFTYEPSVKVDLSGAPGEKTASARIGVSALNYSTAFYTVVFTEAPPLQSFLAGVEISGGLTLADENGPVVFNPARKEYTIAVPQSKQDDPITVNAIKERFSDSVWRSGAPENEGSAAQPPFIEDGVSKVFYLSVNQGPGFVDATYAFSFFIKEDPPAKLATLTSNIGTLYQRTADGVTQPQTSFSPDHYSYTLVVPNETAEATLSAEAEAGGSVYSGAVAAEAAPSVALTVQNPRASRAPAQFTVSAGTYSASVYTVYFDTTTHPPAILSRVSISGGTIIDSDFSPQNTGPYDVRVYSSAPSLIIKAAADDPFEVRYNPKNAFAPPVSGPFYVTALGGPGYTDTQYSFNVNIVQAKSPRLKTVSVNDSPLTLETDVMTYEKTIPYETGGSLYADVSWSVDETEVSHTAYSFDGGYSWEDDPEKDGFTNALSISPAQTKTVLVKVTTFDGNLSIYFLRLIREGNGGANLISVSYNSGAGDVPITLSATSPVTQVETSFLTTSLTIKAVNAGLGAGAQITVEPASLSWSEQEDATPKVVQVKAQDNDGANETYNLIFLKKSKTAMALGGEVSFIKNTDNSWDELHIFKETGNSTLSFHAGRFKNTLTGKVLVVAGGGGGGKGGGENAGDDSGGGGGGGIAYTESSINLSGYFTDGTANITVGAGGAVGSNGGDSFFSTAQAIGGGAGGSASSTDGGFAGGSGGGGGGGPNTLRTSGGTALIQDPSDPNFAYYGHDGGGDNNGKSTGGGGGGAGAAGENASADGKGGTYKTIDITGSAVNYSQGGNTGNISGMGSAIGSGGQGCGNRDNPSKTATSGIDGVVVVRFRYSE
ncbi:MAG: hypothetical protein LBC53_04265 [Spirochaetaceae bacterium]|jgi:hypothetical protein|nr:hypothetical protein [Spirochaetaceae bacterium]